MFERRKRRRRVAASLPPIERPCAGMHQTHLAVLAGTRRARRRGERGGRPRVRVHAAPRGARRPARPTTRGAERGAATRDGAPPSAAFAPTAIASRVSPSGSRARSSAEPSRKPCGVTERRETQRLDNPKRKRRRTDRNLEPLSRFRTRASRRRTTSSCSTTTTNDDDDDATRSRRCRSIPSNAFDKANDVDVTRGGSNDASSQTTLQATLRDACVSALVSPRLRLAFACARRRGTQEDLVGLFVAAARGLGLTARVVAAFDPTPHRASASELARLGVRVGDEPPSRGDVEGRRSTRGGDRRRKRKRETSVQGPAGYGFNSVRCDPSFFENARATSDDDTNAEALAREQRVTWWAEVLCADETERPTKPFQKAFQKTRVGSPWRRTPPAFRKARRAELPRRAALVDDARALRGASPAERLRVRRFSRVGRRARARTTRATPFEFGTRRPRDGRHEKIRMEAFSRCAEKRGDSEWVAETTRILLPDRGFDVNALVASADARDAREMDARAKTERVPSAMHELKNHPL